MTYERMSEEELSHVEVLKMGQQTVIEEVITRIHETEKEVIEEKNVCEYHIIPHPEIVGQAAIVQLSWGLHV